MNWIRIERRLRTSQPELEPPGFYFVKRRRAEQTPETPARATEPVCGLDLIPCGTEILRNPSRGRIDRMHCKPYSTLHLSRHAELVASQTSSEVKYSLNQIGSIFSQNILVGHINCVSMTSHPFPRIEISCLEHRAESIRLMQRQFHALHAALRASESSIKAAISADIGYSDLEIELQYSLAIADLRSHYENLDLEKDNASRSTLCNPSATTSIGIVYVQPSRKDLFYSVIAALTAALAAGNCVIVEVNSSTNVPCCLSTL